MCNPAVALAGVQIGKALLSFAGRSQQANAQQSFEAARTRARQQQINQNAELANRAYIQKAEAENRRLGQEQIRASQEAQDIQIERLEAQGNAEAAAAHAGVAGLSVQNLLNNYQRAEARYRDRIRQNVELVAEDVERRKDAYREEAKGRAASIPPYAPEPVERPSFLGTALQVGGVLVDSYGSTRWGGRGSSS